MATREETRRKRRPKGFCPNPLFLKWLEEYRDEATENGWKSSYTLNKAIRSLKQYPLPINSGSEAKILDNIGNKVAQLLDKRLSEYIANGGSIDDLHCTDTESQPKQRKSKTSQSYTDTTCTSQSRTKTTSQSHTKTTSQSRTKTTSQSRTKTTSQSHTDTTSQSHTDTISQSHSNTERFDTSESTSVKKKRSKSLKEYVPAYRSGPYALLVALHEAEQQDEYYKGYMSKQELIESAQPYCDASFTVPDGPDSYYTAWSSMATLIKKGLISKTGSPPKFSLTDDGLSLAMRLVLVQDDNETSTTSVAHVSQSYVTCSTNSSSSKPPCIITVSDSDDDDIVELSPTTKRLKTSTDVIKETATAANIQLLSATNQSYVPEITSQLSDPVFQLKPGEFEVVLCVDNSESSASKKSKSQFRGLLLDELTKNGVKYSVRKLSIGDFLWIAKEIIGSNPGQLRLPDSNEIVLEYIIERKRMDDLADSIIDRRFHEQKFRMKQSGIKYPVYLVEEYGDMTHCKLPLKSLHQAVTNTQIIDEFHVKMTKDIRESIAYLTIMTRHLQKHYSHKTINAYSVDTFTSSQQQTNNSTVCGIPFDKFNEAYVKNKISTVSEMFARQLIQIPNSSAEKSGAIIRIYPTVAHLYDAYCKCSTEDEREKMLSSVRFGSNSRRFGCAFSKTVYSLYWKGK